MPQDLKPGDRCRVRDDEESRRFMEEINCTTTLCGTEVVVKTVGMTGNIYLTNDWAIPIACLELVSPAPVPKKHARAVSLSRFLQTTYSVKPTKVLPRVKALREIHGLPFLRLSQSVTLPRWFTNMVNYAGVVYDSETGLVTKANGQKLKATKWVSVIGADEAKVQELGTALNVKTFDMILSTSFKDLVRASHSRNFTSCWNTGKITELLELPHVAIAGTKDKHGDYLSRWIVWWDEGKKRCVLNPLPYPQKRDWSKVEALTDRVPIWVCNIDGKEPFNSYNEKFVTKRLYDEMSTKGTNRIKQLSIALDAIKSNETGNGVNK